MIRVSVRTGVASGGASTGRRRRFGLDAPLPADTRIVERAILRHLAEACPTVVPLLLNGAAEETAAGAPTTNRVIIAAGLPELLLLLPGGRLAFCKIKTQAERLSRAHYAFADLCRERAIPLLVVRSLTEARAAIACLLA